MSARSTKATRDSRSRAEWVSFAMASAVLLAIAGAIVALWLQSPRPPELTVTMVGSPRHVGSFDYVTAEIRNGGTETAQNVRVVAEVSAPDGPRGVGEQVVDFLAGGASERVVFVIEAGLTPGDLTLRVDGYAEP